ncbi:MAG: peptidoglycan D,D-transpeptidase FtsI family protein [Candidatus Brocadiales bacterium]
MYSNRLKIIFGLVLASFMVLMGRLGYLQIFESAKYHGISKKRLLKDYTTPARRGNIYDRYGRPLAVEEPAFDLVVGYRNLLYSCLRSKGDMPPPLAQLKAHEDLARGCDSCHSDMGLRLTRLSKLLDSTPQQLLNQAEKIINRVEKIKERVQRRHKKTVRIQEEFASHPIAKDVPLQKAAEFEMNQDYYPGVSLGTRPKRYYPYHDTASHTLGYLGKLTPEELRKARSTLQRGGGEDERLRDYYRSLSSSIDHRVGRAGIEGYYNLDLTGISGRKVEEISLKTLGVDKTIFDMPPSHGNDIFLTIDLDVQRLAEETLGERNGSVVVVDTRTGEVLAMASYPRFNPNTFNRDYSQLIEDPGKPLLNRPVQALLPPGSAFKIVMALTALAEGKIDLNTYFYCSGSITVGRRKFRCTSAHGYVDIKRAIEHSCNIYFFEAAKRLNGKAMRGWAQKFGFGSKTGIDLPYEASGNVPLPRYTGERLNVSIGQGELLVTPLQMTQMVSTVANGGIMVRPHLLKKIVTDDGVTIREVMTPEANRIKIPQEHFLTVQKALRQVVISGTARGKGLKELGVAGKTGTAQIGGSDKNHAWFVGYVPFDDPHYTFCIVVERTTGHGGGVAGPIARELVSGILDIERARKHLTAKREAGTLGY